MHRNTFAFLVVFAFLVPATPSLALDNGSYSGPYGDGGLSLKVKGANVSVEVARPGCQGDIEGRIKKAGKDRWILRKAEYGSVCVIEFRKKGKQVTMEEKEYCPQHGAACAFDGVVTRQ